MIDKLNELWVVKSAKLKPEDEIFEHMDELKSILSEKLYLQNKEALFEMFALYGWLDRLSPTKEIIDLCLQVKAIISSNPNFYCKEALSVIDFANWNEGVKSLDLGIEVPLPEASLIHLTVDLLEDLDYYELAFYVSARHKTYSEKIKLDLFKANEYIEDNANDFLQASAYVATNLLLFDKNLFDRDLPLSASTLKFNVVLDEIYNFQLRSTFASVKFPKIEFKQKRKPLILFSSKNFIYAAAANSTKEVPTEIKWFSPDKSKILLMSIDYKKINKEHLQKFFIYENDDILSSFCGEFEIGRKRGKFNNGVAEINLAAIDEIDCNSIKIENEVWLSG